MAALAEAVAERDGVVVMVRRKGRARGRWMAVRRQRVQFIVYVVVVVRERSRFRDAQCD